MEENMHVVLFLFKHESTKQACFHVKFPFNVYFTPPPPLHHNGNGSILHIIVDAEIV